MSRLLRAELLKLRTTRTFAALVGSTVLVSLASLLLTSLLSDTLDADQVRALFAFDFTGLFIMLLGVMGMAGEWRHRTITGTVLAAPDRLKLLTAKTLSYAVAGAMLSLAVTVMLMLVGTLVLSLRSIDTLDTFSSYLDVLWRNLVVAALLGGLGVCVGALLRNQIVALVIVVGLFIAVEPTLLSLVPQVGRFGPIQGAPGGLVEVNPAGEPGGENILLAPEIAALVMCGWLAAFFALAADRLRRFDLV